MEKQTEKEKHKEEEKDKQSQAQVSLIKTQAVSRINAVSWQFGINIMERGNSFKQK